MQFEELDKIYEEYGIAETEGDYDYEEEILKLFNSTDDNVINMYKNNLLFENSINPVMLYWIGNYYESIDNLKESVKYWKLASENKNISAMCSLASHYESKGKNNLAIKYYTMAFENGYTYALIKLGDYFKDIDNYEEMVKYYLMAFENGESEGLIQLADYHRDVSENYELMIHYLMIIINYNVVPNNIKHQTIISEKYNALCRLGNYYRHIEKNYDLMKKYYLMAIETYDFTYAMTLLGDYYENIEQNYDLMLKYYLMAIEREYPIGMTNLKKYHVKNSSTSEFYKLLISLSEKEEFASNNLVQNEITKLQEKIDSIPLN